MKKYTVIIMCCGILFWTGCAEETTNKTIVLQPPDNANVNKLTNTETNAENVNQPVVLDDSKDTAAKFGGNWDSDKLNAKGEEHTEFSLLITQVGDKIEGSYSVTHFIADEPETEDGNQTPFVGTVKNNVAEIKFDPENTVPGYEEKVMYVEPPDGKKPSTATITISGNALTWKTTSGAINGDVPKDIKLTRDKMNKVSEE